MNNLLLDEDEVKFVSAGLPSILSEAYAISVREYKIGQAKTELIRGLWLYLTFDPSTIEIGTKYICGELYVTASVKIPIKDLQLGVEYYTPGRFRAWLEDKEGEVCVRGKHGSPVSYDSESLPYCLAMCFAWLAMPDK